MLRIIIKPLALVFTLATTLGVLMHDTRVDKASAIALAAPAVVATYGVAASTADFRGNEHTHSERATENLKRMVVAQPRLHTRSTEDKKYLTPKKTIYNTGDDDQLFQFA